MLSARQFSFLVLGTACADTAARATKLVHAATMMWMSASHCAPRRQCASRPLTQPERAQMVVHVRSGWRLHAALCRRDEGETFPHFKPSATNLRDDHARCGGRDRGRSNAISKGRVAAALGWTFWSP